MAYVLTVKRIIVTVFLLMWCVGCRTSPEAVSQTQTLYLSPIPVPKYLDFVSPLPGEQIMSPSRTCIGINYAYIWEPGNQADDLSNHLKSNTLLALDSVGIGNAVLVFSNLGGLISRPDGSHVGLLVVCTDSEWELAKGLHLVSMTTKTMSGKELSYEWAFEVK